MKKPKKEKNFIKKPIYEGGAVAIKNLIREHLKYPAKALQNKIEGTVSITYTIDHRGKVIEAKVISGLGHGCDEEAVRLVKLLKFNVPKNRGVKVQFHKKIQIHFRLPRPKKVLAGQQQAGTVQYHYVPKAVSPKSPGEEKPPPRGYTFTVEI